MVFLPSILPIQKANVKKDIYLPHVHYWVKIRPFTKAPPDIQGAFAYVHRESNNISIVFIKKRCDTPTIAHELVHVLQNICRARNIDFATETEHMGYLMGYLMGKVLGYRYKS